MVQNKENFFFRLSYIYTYMAIGILKLKSTFVILVIVILYIEYCKNRFENIFE